MKRVETHPHADTAPSNPVREIFWRIRHDGLKKASDHYVINFTKWYCGAASISLSYEGAPPRRKSPRSSENK